MQPFSAAKINSEDPSRLDIVARPFPWTRPVNIYIPAQLPQDASAPFMVVGDGEVVFDGGKLLATVLDNPIAQMRIPPVVAALA